jgi:hypothetical protein
MLERANLTSRNGSWSDWFGNGGDWSDMLTARNALIFGGGAMLALVTARLASPFAGRSEQARKLYRDHAEIKVRLFELEHKAKDDPSWIEDLRTLHQMIAAHAHEEERVEFPKLRAALSHSRCATLHGEVSREKSMLA